MRKFNCVANYHSYFESGIRSIAVSQDNEDLYIADITGCIKNFSLTTHRHKQEISVPLSSPNSLREILVTKNGAHIIILGKDNLLAYNIKKKTFAKDLIVFFPYPKIQGHSGKLVPIKEQRNGRDGSQPKRQIYYNLVRDARGHVVTRGYDLRASPRELP
jgi:hypothetical protein